MQILRFLTLCLGGLAIAAPGAALSPGDLVINEVMANPAAVPDSSGEWVEVFNATPNAIDLVGLTLEDNVGSHVIAASEYLSVSPGDSPGQPCVPGEGEEPGT